MKPKLKFNEYEVMILFGFGLIIGSFSTTLGLITGLLCISFGFLKNKETELKK